MAKVPKLVSGGGKAPAKFSEFTKRKTRRRVPFISVSDVVFPDIVFAYNPIKNFTNSKVGPDPVWSYTAPNYNDDGSYTGSTPWWNTDLLRWEWGGPSYTQFAQNSKFEGAGIGVSPAGWNVATTTSNGITREIVGAGTGYIDVRFSGTCVGATVYMGVAMSSSSYPVAALSDTWTGFVKISLLTGDWSALNPRIELLEATSANGYLASSSVSLSGKSGQIVSHTRTLTNASVGKCALNPFSTTITVGTTVDFTVRIEQPQLTKTATVMPYIATGIGETITCNSVPQPRIDAGKGLWGGPQVSNLASPIWNTTPPDAHSVSAINPIFQYMLPSSVLSGVQYYFRAVIEPHGGQPATNVRLTINNGASWNGAVSTKVSLSTKTEIELPFIGYSTNSIYYKIGAQTETGAIDSDCFGGINIVSYSISTVKNAPYVPPGATQPSNAATTGGNGLNIPMDAGMLNCLGASGVSAMTLMHEAYMGVGSADLANDSTHLVLSCGNLAKDVLYFYKTTAGRIVGTSGDGATVGANISLEWSANEIHRRYVQTSSNGTRFRVGYQRFTSAMVEITSGIQWSHTGAESTWAVFDGSFNPLTWLRFGLNLSVPVWHRGCWLSNKTLLADEIALRNIKIANV